MTATKCIYLIVAVIVSSQPLRAQDAGAATKPPVVVTPLMKTTTTTGGGPIVLPQKDAQVVVSTYDIAPGAVLPVHKHPFPRYAYVLAGNLKVTNTETGKSAEFKAGDFVIEDLGQWHKGESVGSDPVKLLVIDQVEKDKNNVVLKGGDSH